MFHFKPVKNLTQEVSVSASDVEPTPRRVNAPAPAPSGGVTVPVERLAALGPAWAAIRAQIRVMDTVELGETEPAVTFGKMRVEP